MFVRAVDFHGLPVRGNIKLFLCKRLAAERTGKKLLINQVLLIFCLVRSFRIFPQIIKSVRSHTASDPETDADWFCSVPRIISRISSDVLRSNNHLCDTVALLRCQKTKCVPEDDGHTAVTVIFVRFGGAKASVGDGKGHESEIGLRLSTAGREVEQVDDVSLQIFRMDDSLQIHQDKGYLKWPPGEFILWILRINKILEIAFNALTVLLRIVLYAVLHKDDAVHETERLERDVVRLDDLNAFPYSSQCVPTVSDDGIPDFLRELRIIHPKASCERVVNPLFI